MDRTKAIHLNISVTAVAVAAIGLAAFPSKARADDVVLTMRQICQNVPCVYDANGKIVGLPNPAEILSRYIAGKWYNINFLRAGIADNLLLYYANVTCTGQPYMTNIGQLPRPALYDGRRFWGPQSEAADFNWQSYQYVDQNGQTQCVNYGPNCYGTGKQCGDIGSLAAPIGQPVVFAAPFDIR